MRRILRHLSFGLLWEQRAFHAWFWPAAAVAAAAAAVSLLGIMPIRTRESFVLHYTPVFGIDRVGPWYAALIPGILAVALLAVNALLAATLARTLRILAATVGVATVLLECGLLAAAALIVSLNR